MQPLNQLLRPDAEQTERGSPIEKDTGDRLMISSRVKRGRSGDMAKWRGCIALWLLQHHRSCGSAFRPASPPDFQGERPVCRALKSEAPKPHLRQTCPGAVLLQPGRQAAQAQNRNGPVTPSLPRPSMSTRTNPSHSTCTCQVDLNAHLL